METEKIEFCWQNRKDGEETEGKGGGGDSGPHKEFWFRHCQVNLADKRSGKLGQGFGQQHVKRTQLKCNFVQQR